MSHGMTTMRKRGMSAAAQHEAEQNSLQSPRLIDWFLHRSAFLPQNSKHRPFLIQTEKLSHLNVYLCRIFHILSNMWVIFTKAHKQRSHWDPYIWALCHQSPFLITKPVGASDQLKLSICEHSKMLSSMNIYPEAPGEIPQHCPGLSLCLFPSPVPALHLQLCLPTQKLPAYTTSQVTVLSGFQLPPAPPQVHWTSRKPNSNHWGSSQ